MTPDAPELPTDRAIAAPAAASPTHSLTANDLLDHVVAASDLDKQCFTPPTWLWHGCLDRPHAVALGSLVHHPGNSQVLDCHPHQVSVGSTRTRESITPLDVLEAEGDDEAAALQPLAADIRLPGRRGGDDHLGPFGANPRLVEDMDNGKPVLSKEADFAEPLKGIQVGKPIDAVVLRKGTKKTFKGLTLPEAKKAKAEAPSSP
jgi:hypothetical protein